MVKPLSPQINWNHPLTKGLVFAAPFSERGGVNPLDLVSKVSGTFTGTNVPSWVNDVFGTEVNFTGTVGSGTTGYATFGTRKILAGLNDFSIFAFLKTTGDYSGTNGGTIYTERGASGSDIVKIEMDGGAGQANRFRFTYRDDGNHLTQLATDTTLINDGKLHFVGVTRSGLSMTAYRDGVVSFTGAMTAGTTNTMTNTIQIRIGGDPADATANFNGKMLTVLGWSRILSAQEVQQLYTNPWQLYQHLDVAHFSQSLAN